MGNVLPPESRKKLWRDERARLLMALSVALFMSALVAYAALLPSYLAVRFGVGITPPGTGSSSSESTDDRAAIAAAQSLVTQLQPITAATSSPSLPIATALSHRPKGIAISQFSYTSGKSGQITISGTAPKPELINEYKSSLAADPTFSNVSVPVGALIGTSDGTFTITLSGAF